MPSLKEDDFEYWDYVSLSETLVKCFGIFYKNQKENIHSFLKKYGCILYIQ